MRRRKCLKYGLSLFFSAASSPQEMRAESEAHRLVSPFLAHRRTKMICFRHVTRIPRSDHLTNVLDAAVTKL